MRNVDIVEPLDDCLRQSSVVTISRRQRGQSIQADVWAMDQDRDRSQNLGQTRQHNTTTHVKSRRLDIRNYKIEDFVALNTFYISYIVNVEIKLSEIRISVAYTDQRRGTKGLF
jgi:hypothetical protein